MPPKDYTSTLTTVESWIEAENSKVHSIAVRYIEENVDLIDKDLQKFLDDCPRVCQLEVYEMLRKAGIDMKEYVINNSLKQWEKYIQNLDKYIEKTITHIIIDDTLEGVV